MRRIRFSFVGYSHDDTVLQYLASGLSPSDSKRYALNSGKDRFDHWHHLGIEPLHYEIATEAEPHQNLRTGLQEWAKNTEMGALEHRSRIITLAENAPPEVGPDLDYLLRQLREPSSVAALCKHAKDPGWISWVTTHGFIKELFKPDLIEDEQRRERSSHWAYWLAEMGIDEGHVEAFNIVSEKNGSWNGILWFAVARIFHSHDDIPHDQFNHWIRALLAAPIPLGGTSHYLGYALTKCKAPERMSSAIILFDFMTRAIPKQKERFTSHEKEEWKDVRWGVAFPEDDYWLRKAWKKFFSANLDRFAEPLLMISERNLSHAYKITKIASGDYDFFNMRRYQIDYAGDSERRTYYNKVIDVLIDAIRDCLRWMIRNRLEDGIVVARRYLRSERILFQRLGLDALTVEDNTTPPDDLLRWILETGPYPSEQGIGR